MADAQAKFLTGNLFRHVSVMSLTSSVGLMAIFAVDFIDMIFIAMLGKAELAAAVGYAATILFFTTSFGIGMAIAAGALVARALGAGDAQLAQERRTHALVYGVTFGIAFFGFGLVVAGRDRLSTRRNRRDCVSCSFVSNNRRAQSAVFDGGYDGRCDPSRAR